MERTSSNTSAGKRRALTGVCALLLLVLLSAGTARAQQTFTVTTTDEFGFGSLRTAIDSANVNGNPGAVDVIEFALEGTGPFVFTLVETTLPDITEPVRIDGATQPGYDGAPVIVIDGSGLPDSNFGDGLVLGSGSDGSEILGLSIINFNGDGIAVRSGDHQIAGCYIGVDAAGNAAGNGGNGIRVRGDGNTIGGTAPEARNVISGNTGTGVEIYYGNNNEVLGNYIGTGPSGTADLGNGEAGVAIVFGSSDNVIGGATAGARNVISGNAGTGIWLRGGDGAPFGNVILGNYIGTDASGENPLPNGGSGVAISQSAFGNIVGGTEPGAANRIAFNQGSGVFILPAQFSDSVDNAVRGNEIFANAGLGIDLGADGATANDPGDADTGPNNLQNFPGITAAGYDAEANALTVTYQVSTDPANATYPLAVDFYLADADRQEGKVYLGTDTYTTDDYGGGPEKTVTFTPQTALTGEDALVATATDDAGNTSEFSPSAGLAAPELTVSPPSLSFGSVPVGEAVENSVTITNAGTADLELTSISLSGAEAFSVVSGGEPGTLPSEASRTVVARFAPQSVGNASATLTVESNVGTEEVSFQGTGLGLDVARDAPAQAGTEAGFTASLPAAFTPTESTLFYRPTGQIGYASAPFTPVSDTSYRATIPAGAVTLRGFEYYARFSDGQQTVTFPANNPAANPVRERVFIPQETSETVPASRIYRMVSVPLDLEQASLEAVLEDDYGAQDPERWRLLRWDSEAEQYREFPNLEQGFAPGRAFWLITDEGGAFDVEEGLSVAASEPYVLQLAPGWNQIATPFAFPVAWADVEGAADVEVPIFYDGGAADPWRYDRQVLQPWEGYFVFNASSGPVTLAVPPVEAGETLAPEIRSEEHVAAHAYVLQLRAEVEGDEGRRLVDAHNYIGFGAQPGRVAEPPGVGPRVRLSILNKEGGRLAESFKSSGGKGRWWDVEVAVARPDAPFATREHVEITLHAQRQLPEGFRRYVLDRDAGRMLPVEGGRVSVEVGRDRPVRRLRVILGTPDFAQAHSEGAPLAPTTFALGKNYPNPFINETTIEYQLRERCHVVLEVYNVLGQRVMTLVDAEQEAGPHTVTWNASGRPLPSGLYVYRLRACSFTASHKMVLLH